MKSEVEQALQELSNNLPMAGADAPFEIVKAALIRGAHYESLIDSPETLDFLRGVRYEAAHQVKKWGDAHDRDKSAENWFWLVGYLAGKCLRAVITGDRDKALHHTVSTAAACANWHAAIKRDTTGTGIASDNDIRPIEIARFEGGNQAKYLGQSGMVPHIRV